MNSLDKNNLLIQEPFVPILPSLARIFNVDGAAVLQQCHWVSFHRKTSQEQSSFWQGEWWCTYSQEYWHRKILPWVKSLTTVSKVFADLISQGVLICAKPFAHNTVGKKNKNQVRWYRVNYEVLAQKLGENSDIAMTQFLYERNATAETAQSNLSEPVCDNTVSVSSPEPRKVSLKAFPGKGFSDFHDDTVSVSSSIYKENNKYNKKSNASECAVFSGSEQGNFEELKSASLAEPEKETNGIGSNQEIPAETKFSAAPPENLTKEERFSWWGKHLEDPTFLRRKLETLRWDFKFLQAFGSWLLDSEAHWSKNGYKAQSAALAVLNNAGFGEKALNHRSRLATYLCKQADQPTAAPQIASQAPKVESTNSKYAHLTDSEVTAQFLTYWQEAETGAPMLRPRLKNAYEIGYAEEMHRRNPQWDGKTLAQLVEINNQLATA